jgi:hypothetical protein
MLFSCALVSPSFSAASTTIGQLAPGTSPPALCVTSNYDLVQPTVTSGSTYVVPAGGVAITSWSTNAAAGNGQTLAMKVFRKVGQPLTYKAVGHDGPRALAPSKVNTFAVNIPVQPGDVLGVNDENATAVNNACFFSAPGDLIPELFGNLADGQSGDFSAASDTDARTNVTAVVGFKPSDAFSFGGVKRNTHKGTATLAVDVPGPGTLSLTGKGVRAQRAGREAAASKNVTAAGTVKLKIRAKGKAKHKLNDSGKAKVKAKITYTPNGASSGDVIGDPSTQTKRVKLIKK